MTAPTITVREASMDDAAVVRDLRLAALKAVPHFYGGNFDEVVARRLGLWEAQLLHADEDGRWCFLAYAGEQPVGVGWVTLTPRDERGPCELQGLWVSEGYRALGVGHLLNNFRENFARDMGVEAMHVTCAGSNTKARSLMESCGYVVLKVESWLGREPETLVHMTKSL